METYNITLPGSRASQVHNKMRQEVWNSVFTHQSEDYETVSSTCPLLSHEPFIIHPTVGFPGGSDQYSCLENSMDRGTRWATVHGVAKSQTGLRD